LLYAQQSQPTPLTTQERQMIEEARDTCGQQNPWRSYGYARLARIRFAYIRASQ
jgi:hypothetical protein